MSFPILVRSRLASSSSATSVRAVAAARNISSSTSLRLATAANLHSESSGPWSEKLTSSRLNRYLVVAEDYKDAGANSRRLEVRERHLEEAQKGKVVGRVELGGALLKKDFSEINEEVGPGPLMGGSVMIVLGESIEDVKARVAQDEYSKGRVWDSANVKVYPFLQARLPSATIESADASTLDASREVDPSLSLGQLRQDVAQGKGHTIVTLGALRKMHRRAGPPTAAK